MPRESILRVSISHKDNMHSCGVNLLAPHDKSLLVKVRLWLFTLNGGFEWFQILLRVWYCIVCLWDRNRDTISINWLQAADNFSFSLAVFCTHRPKKIKRFQGFCRCLLNRWHSFFYPIFMVECNIIFVVRESYKVCPNDTLLILRRMVLT